VQTTQAPTGAATILLDAAGENQIIIIPGANAELTLPLGFTPPADIAVALAQLETPQAATAGLFRSLTGARRILNVAPAAAILPELLSVTDMLVLNETEAAILAQREAEPAALAIALAAETMREVILTAGAIGAFWARPDGVVIDAAPPRVAVTDTTGAGDAFLGAFAAFSAEGLAQERILRQAVTAGALAGAVGAVSVAGLGLSAALVAGSFSEAAGDCKAGFVSVFCSGRGVVPGIKPRTAAFTPTSAAAARVVLRRQGLALAFFLSDASSSSSTGANEMLSRFTPARFDGPVATQAGVSRISSSVDKASNLVAEFPRKLSARNESCDPLAKSCSIVSRS
jgi:hypothetical protein